MWDEPGGVAGEGKAAFQLCGRGMAPKWKTTCFVWITASYVKFLALAFSVRERQLCPAGSVSISQVRKVSEAQRSTGQRVTQVTNRGAKTPSTSAQDRLWLFNISSELPFQICIYNGYIIQGEHTLIFILSVVFFRRKKYTLRIMKIFMK